LSRVSLVVPVYNEAGLIESSAATIRTFLEGRGGEFEVVFSDDGSTDGTTDVLRRLEKDDATRRTRLVVAEQNQGKGGALNLGLAAATGDVVAYIDADMEIPISHVGDVLQGIAEGYDLCVGSKAIGDSQRESRRKIAHKVYNGMVRNLLGSRVYDHSCGVKAFRREVVDAVLHEMRDKKWVWDTEFLVRAQRKGFRVKEVPIHSVSRRESKVRFVSAVIDSFGAVLRLYFQGVKVPRNLRKDATTPARRANATG
jgi:hypothetical protein